MDKLFSTYFIGACMQSLLEKNGVGAWLAGESQAGRPQIIGGKLRESIEFSADWRFVALDGRQGHVDGA
jgi:hypothetical protein